MTASSPSRNRELAHRIVDSAVRLFSGKFVGAHDLAWLLERDGVQVSNEEPSVRLSATAVRHPGFNANRAGTYGADPALRERANFLWSLGSLTFLHEWAQAIVVEQLYRAAKIARNEPYHH